MIPRDHIPSGWTDTPCGRAARRRRVHSRDLGGSGADVLQHESRLAEGCRLGTVSLSRKCGRSPPERSFPVTGASMRPRTGGQVYVSHDTWSRMVLTACDDVTASARAVVLAFQASARTSILSMPREHYIIVLKRVNVVLGVGLRTNSAIGPSSQAGLSYLGTHSFRIALCE